MPFSKLPRESLRALYYKLGGTDDISDLRTRRALLKKIYEAMGNDPADLGNMHRANSVLQKISEVASVGGNGGKYVGVDISDARPLDRTSPKVQETTSEYRSSYTNPLILSSRATAEINAVLSAGKNPIFELDSGILSPGASSGYGISSEWTNGFAGWKATIVFRFSLNREIRTKQVVYQSSDYNSGESAT